MHSSVLIAGRRRSYVTVPGYRLGMRPGNYGKRYPAEIYSREQIHRLMTHMGRGNAGQRNRAMVVMMWRCGLRVSEVLALTPGDLDLVGGVVTIRHSKGRRKRTISVDNEGLVTIVRSESDQWRRVGIDPEAAAVVTQWLERRRQLGVGPRRPVFCVISRPTVGKPIHSSCVREALKDASERAGLVDEGVRVHPHGLRHTFACELAREGVQINVIQQLLGHATLATTARYLAHLSPWEAIDALRARTWATHAEPASVPVERGDVAA